MTSVLAAPTMDSATPAARPALRVVVRPAPRREPPFDDEIVEPSPARPYDRRLPFERPATQAVPIPPTLRPYGLPDPTIWGRRLLIGLIETADGHRPLSQLASMLSQSVGRGLCADFDRDASLGRPHWLHRAIVLNLRGCEPAAGVAEVCATVDTGRRVRAVAMRLEEHHDRWRCTRLQLG
ncbi:MAG: Rv3235 family protein [Jatrophihabitans sp.]